jgi:L-alanine-DL-glutamate epimerase-like enolase superfamily enzyme
MQDDLIAEPLHISDGEIVAPTGPGVGARIDPEKLAYYRLDGH